MNKTENRQWRLAALGSFLLLLGVFLATAPGEIEITDGVQRYDVSRNLINRHEPVATNWLFLSKFAHLTNPKTGKHYWPYNAAASITALPPMLISRMLPGHSEGRNQFAFSLTSVFFGALIGPLLLLAYRKLGVRLSIALICTCLFSLCTLWWPSSLTVFDQNQHAVFLFAAVLIAWEAGRRDSLVLAATAGLVAGLLLTYRETYVLVLPGVAIALLAHSREGTENVKADSLQIRRTQILRLCVFVAASLVGLGLFFFYNWIRVGSLYPSAGKTITNLSGQPVDVFADPFGGFLTLAISPGKGFLWFSPPLLLITWGFVGLFRRAPALAGAICLASLLHLAIIVSLTFASGDWCWGPRYLVPIMPLWALCLPLALTAQKVRRLVVPLGLCGLAVQMLAVSIDYSRFFHEHHLSDSLWMDRWVYFKNSQLIARPLEIIADLRGEPHRRDVPASYYHPRPWWGWIFTVTSSDRPINPLLLTFHCVFLTSAGAVLMFSAVRRSSPILQEARDDVQPEVSPSAPAPHTHAGTISVT